MGFSFGEDGQKVLFSWWGLDLCRADGDAIEYSRILSRTWKRVQEMKAMI